MRLGRLIVAAFCASHTSSPGAGLELCQLFKLQDVVGLASTFHRNGSYVALLPFSRPMSCLKMGSLHLMHAGLSSTYSICISNQDIRTSREPEHPEKKIPTRPTHLCQKKGRIMQRRCQRPWFVTGREKDVSAIGASLPCSHRCGSQDG